MQDLLKKIVEMDEQARKIEQQAKLEKVRSEEEVEQLKEQIYNDYIARARDRIEKNMAVDRQRADERIAARREESEQAKEQMRRLYEEKHESWVDEIVRRSLA